MPKVTGPLFSLKAQGQFGKSLIFKRGGIVVNYFKPRNPNSAAQQAQREAFKELYVMGLTQEQADLLYAAILHEHDDLYSVLSHLHDDRYSQLGHGHTGVYPAIADFEAHKARHEWLGADELRVRDLLMNAYPLVVKDWRDNVGFVASHVSSGAFTNGILFGIMATAAINGSRVCLYSGSSLAMVQAASILARIRTRINPSSLMTACTFWFGNFTNPTAPTATEHHVGFKVVDGLVYASCGNGTNGNLESTGVTIGQYGILDLYIKETATAILYYVNGVLKKTFTTYRPNSGTLYPSIILLNTAANVRTVGLFPVYMMQGE